jgi:phage terminase Nu1 subunit (DNA packaging protein)
MCVPFRAEINDYKNQKINNKMRKNAEKAQANTPAHIVNRGELSEATGAALTTIDKWVRAGCPVVQRGAGKGQEWKFSLPDVITWLRARDVEAATGKTTEDESKLKLRRLQADTAAAELALAKARAEVAPLDQVERMVARAFAEVRAAMRQLPGRVVSRLIGETDERKFKSVLGEEIDQVLESLANANLAGSDDEEEDEDEA